MSFESNDDYLQRVRAEIRAQAESLPRRPLLSRPAPIVSARAENTIDSIERDRLDYPIGELTGAHYVEFVDRASRAILKRAPTFDETQVRLGQLAAGRSKAELLGDLRWSPEGRHFGTRVRGLAPRYALAKLGHVPVLGYLLQWGATLAGLPLILRHQRAVEAMLSAGDHTAAQTSRALVARIDTLSNIDALLARRNEEMRAFADELIVERSALQASMEHVANELGARRDSLQSGLEAMSDELAEVRTSLAGFGVGLESANTELSSRLEALRIAHVALGETATVQRERVDTLEGTANALSGRLDELAFLRQRVYAINHWSHNLSLAFAQIEQIAEQREKERAASAAHAALAVVSADTARAARNLAWANAFSADLPERARVLALACAGDWPAMLVDRGFEVCVAEPNAALFEAARAHGIEVEPASARDVLRRASDASLDGLSMLAFPVLARSAPSIEWLAEAARTLCGGGVLMLAFAREPAALVDALLEASTPTISPDVLMQALLASGFVDATRIDAADGSIALIAQRALA